jgi:hypothetical protein
MRATALHLKRTEKNYINQTVYIIIIIIIRVINFTGFFENLFGCWRPECGAETSDRKCRGVEKRPLEVCTGDLVRNTKQQNV